MRITRYILEGTGEVIAELESDNEQNYRIGPLDIGGRFYDVVWYHTRTFPYAGEPEREPDHMSLVEVSPRAIEEEDQAPPDNLWTSSRVGSWVEIPGPAEPIQRATTTYTTSTVETNSNPVQPAEDFNFEVLDFNQLSAVWGVNGLLGPEGDENE